MPHHIDALAAVPVRRYTARIRAVARFLAVCFLLFVVPLTTSSVAQSETTPDSPAIAQEEKSVDAPDQTIGHMGSFFKDVIQYFGTRYRWGGTTPKGFDCSGFVGFMYNKAFNMNLPRTSKEMSSMGTRVSKENLQPGDLVFFKTRGKGINHVGIFIGSDTFVHSSTTKGVTEEKLIQNFYEKQFAGGVRLLNNAPAKPAPVNTPQLLSPEA
ncbi:MAG: NlpC/P60 family protein [Chlorobiaceae bacterium]